PREARLSAGRAGRHDADGPQAAGLGLGQGDPPRPRHQELPRPAQPRGQLRRLRRRVPWQRGRAAEGVRGAPRSLGARGDHDRQPSLRVVRDRALRPRLQAVERGPAPGQARRARRLVGPLRAADASPMIKAKPEVESLTPYVAPLEGRRGLLRLDFNESTLGPSPRVLEAVRALPPEAYAAYPEYAGLNEAFAETLGITAEHVEAFKGVDAAIQAIFDAYGDKGATFLTTTPTFGYYEPCAQQQGMTIEDVPYLADLGYPLVAIRQRLQTGPRLFFVCNPNNPTGTL